VRNTAEERLDALFRDIKVLSAPRLRRVFENPKLVTSFRRRCSSSMPLLSLRGEEQKRARLGLVLQRAGWPGSLSDPMNPPAVWMDLCAAHLVQALNATSGTCQLLRDLPTAIAVLSFLGHTALSRSSK